MVHRKNLVTFGDMRPGDRYRLPSHGGRQDPTIYTLKTVRPDENGREYLLNTVSVDDRGNVFKGWPNRMSFVDLIIDEKDSYIPPYIETNEVEETESIVEEIDRLIKKITQVSLKNQRQGQALLEYIQQLIEHV